MRRPLPPRSGRKTSGRRTPQPAVVRQPMSLLQALDATYDSNPRLLAAALAAAPGRRRRAEGARRLAAADLPGRPDRSGCVPEPQRHAALSRAPRAAGLRADPDPDAVCQRPGQRRAGDRQGAGAGAAGDPGGQRAAGVAARRQRLSECGARPRDPAPRPQSRGGAGAHTCGPTASSLRRARSPRRMSRNRRRGSTGSAPPPSPPPADVTGAEAAFENAVGIVPGEVTLPAAGFAMPPTETEALGMAQDANPELVAARHMMDASRLGIDLARDQLLPVVTLNGLLERQRQLRVRTLFAERQRGPGAGAGHRADLPGRRPRSRRSGRPRKATCRHRTWSTRRRVTQPSWSAPHGPTCWPPASGWMWKAARPGPTLSPNAAWPSSNRSARAPRWIC